MALPVVIVVISDDASLVPTILNIVSGQTAELLSSVTKQTQAILAQAQALEPKINH